MNSSRNSSRLSLQFLSFSCSFQQFFSPNYILRPLHHWIVVPLWEILDSTLFENPRIWCANWRKTISPKPLRGLHREEAIRLFHNKLSMNSLNFMPIQGTVELKTSVLTRIYLSIFLPSSHLDRLEKQVSTETSPRSTHWGFPFVLKPIPFYENRKGSATVLWYLYKVVNIFISNKENKYYYRLSVKLVLFSTILSQYYDKSNDIFPKWYRHTHHGHCTFLRHRSRDKD